MGAEAEACESFGVAVGAGACGGFGLAVGAAVEA